MELDFEKISTHAQARLPAGTQSLDRAEQIEAFKRFLRLENERLRMRHRFGLGGQEIAAGRSYQIDLVIQRACRLIAEEFDPRHQAELHEVAVVALGGYGRGELAPGSDVDILFLRRQRPDAAVQPFVERVLAFLWDIGLTIGHSYRSVADCLSLARQDLHSRTALCESRLVAGSAPLLEELSQALSDSLYGNARLTAAFIEELSRETEARYAKYGRSVCLLEPNLKESAGGLRDLHTVLWVGQARFGCHDLAGLQRDGHLSEAEYTTARRAYSFVLRVRNEVHFSSGRKNDLLTSELQPTVALHVGFRARGSLLASESLMREYYQYADVLHRLSEEALARARSRPSRFPFRLRLRRRGLPAGLELNAGKIDLKGSLPSSAQKLMEVFAAVQTSGAGLSADLRSALRSRLKTVERASLNAPEVGRLFLKVLASVGRVGLALREMAASGFLGRYLPEFARITYLIQHDYYHRYTVDEHTLRALDVLDEVAQGHTPERQPFKHLLDEIGDPASLYLGLLLHDIGKGRGGGHVALGTRLAERICRRLQLPRATAEQAVFLVHEHLLMAQLSQRRDLSEESLTLRFVETVGTLERLNALMLLTYADHCAVGPGVWNEWKAELLWELYSQARGQLTGAKPVRWDADRRVRVRQRLVEELAERFPRSLTERHLALMPEKYLRSASAQSVAAHLQMAARLDSEPLVADWRLNAAGHFTELTVCARDAQGLLGKLAGTLSARGLNILSVDVLTREDGVIFDGFKVCEVIGREAVGEDRWDVIQADLVKAITAQLDVEQAVAAWRAQDQLRLRGRRAHKPSEPRVHFDNEASEQSTVLEVVAVDQPGLVYAISHTLTELGLSITFAKIATEKSQALDVFYVTDAQGLKLSQEACATVAQRLLEALRELGAQRK